jgi:hypothetical protein
MSALERVGPKRGNNFPTGEELLDGLTAEDMMSPMNSPRNNDARKKKQILDKVSSDASNSYIFIHNVLSNKELKHIYNEYLNTLPPHMLGESIELYKTINSDNFRTLLEELSTVEQATLHNRITNLLASTETLQRISALIYNIINNAVKDSLDDKKRNSRYVYKTAKNVQSSEDIESLGMTTMTSVLSNFTNYRVFKKGSASKSVIFLAELAPNPDSVNVVKARNTLKPSTHTLYFKMYPTGKLTNSFTFSNPGLDTERSMYSELFKLVKYGITPNILCRVATGVFPDSYNELLSSDRINREVRRLFRSQMAEVNKKSNLFSREDWKDIGLTITQPGGKTFYDVFKSLHRSERKQIMFQLLYTLYVFEQLKISHGDLHVNNIFVVDVEPTELCYVIEGVQYRFTTTKLLKIYDFDQSNISEDTDITINGRNTVRISRVFNSNRRLGGYFDKIYGKGEQFVRKSDLMIVLANGLNVLAYNYNILDFGGATDPEITYFFRNVMPGFYTQNPISRELICDTFTELLKRATPELIKEIRDVFLIPEGQDVNIKNMEIGADICNMSWNTYYSEILPKFYGCLVKDNLGKVSDNNKLIIPDTIVLPIRDMINNPYFDVLKSTEPIDITRQLVYTLDGKL